MGELDREKALQALAELGELQMKAEDEYKAENDAWWNGLTEKEREDAFYAVVKRIYQAEIKERGTYRYALYDVFGFGTHMYHKGMNCGYMALHNSIMDDEQFNEHNKWMAGND